MLSITFGLRFVCSGAQSTADQIFHPHLVGKLHRVGVTDAARSRGQLWPGLCPSASLGWGPGALLGFSLLGECPVVNAHDYPLAKAASPKPNTTWRLRSSHQAPWLGGCVGVRGAVVWHGRLSLLHPFGQSLPVAGKTV